MEYFIIILAAVAAGGITLAVWTARERYLNMLAAEPYLEKLATLAHRIEADADAPETAKRLAMHLADNAFNAEAHRAILSAPVPRERTDYVKQVKRECGPHGNAAIEMLQVFARLVILSDLRLGRMFRGKASVVPAMHRHPSSAQQRKELRKRYVVTTFTWAEHQAA